MYYENAARIDLLQPDVLRRYQGNPERIREFVHAQADEQTIIVDEVQRVPELLSAVHALIEEKRGWTFVLTGSSARKLKQTGVDLMAGRAVVRSLHPFMASELGRYFNLSTALTQGMLPIVWDAPCPTDVLKSYVAFTCAKKYRRKGLSETLGGSLASWKRSASHTAKCLI